MAMLKGLIAIMLLVSTGMVHVHGNDHDHEHDHGAPSVSFFAHVDSFDHALPKASTDASRKNSNPGQAGHFHIHLLDSAVLFSSMRFTFHEYTEILPSIYLLSYSGPSLTLQTRPPLAS